jgi:carboxynorspermidine decarboxylase
MKKLANIIDQLPSPAWLLEEKLLRENLKTIDYIQKQSGARVLVALKGYALWGSFDILRDTLYGCCASGLMEAKLGFEEFGREVHTYSPAFKEGEIEEIASLSNHIVFNSPAQFHKFSSKTKEINPNISMGIRINPEYSQASTELYNPCGLYSRLGTTVDNFDGSILESCEGFHLHALCQQDSYALERVLDVFERKFEPYLYNLKWINFGGGHHITKDGYDVEKLIELIVRFRDKYGVQIYLEPGEAIGWGSGTLVATVLDIVHNGIDIAILDTSAEAHMPDSIIMPYRVEVRGASRVGERRYSYRLGGNSCLSGDIMGDYSFDTPLKVGDRVIFEDQMHYTMVKATTFNGIPLPSICILRADGRLEILKEFGYTEFKNRLS